ncbi:FHA domain-containing protein [Methylotenera sp.]|uniref:FHA domain-containing protein n=1 Tax=Methylotenera sp. TaxID=2051956 RepID=UPI00273130E5|nr:FHA domain-containing protein [Methylotenera sp.]MDP2230031.1 FHA domain-containing protein [Methylotenera sp.]MDP3140088.1 FHA domain-containing protein [Methylotenera sp.]
MAKLIFSLDNTILNEYQLSKERTSIGRRPTNDIHIDNLAVSGEHATILKVGDNFYIEDQDSTNGTEVNAKLVKSHLLQPGDLIEFGKYQLKFINEAKLIEQSSNDGAFEKTIMMRPSEFKALQQTTLNEAGSNLQSPLTQPDLETQKNSQAASTSKEANAPVLPTGRIQVLNGSSVGRELVLNKSLTTLGKTGVQVAVITKRPNGYFVTHVEGKVFPTVNSKSTGAQAFALSDHDVIELAGVKMEFYLDKI